MQPKTRLAALLAVSALAGCAPEIGGRRGECGATAYQGLIGSDIAAATLPASLSLRMVGPDVVVTADRVPERMNIWVGEAGTVEQVYCG